MKIFKKGFNLNTILLLIAGLIILGLMGFNIRLFCKQENKDFFKASFIDIATLGIGTYIVFFLSERLNESRRRNDCIEHIITEIENIVCDEKFFSMQRSALMMQSSCANKIKYLKDAKFPKIQEEVDFIESKINDIRDLYSYHNSSEEDLKSVEKDFEKKRNEISDKCDKMPWNRQSKILPTFSLLTMSAGDVVLLWAASSSLGRTRRKPCWSF